MTASGKVIVVGTVWHRDDESAPLKWEWIANALHKGAELVAHESILCPPATFRMSIGVDPAVSLQSGSDLSAIVTIGRTRTARSK